MPNMAPPHRIKRIVHCIPAAYTAYRYWLELQLLDAPAPRLAVILKNPSTASATRSDPTIGKVEAWARRHGFAVVICVNLFALRATHPSSLNSYPDDVIVGPENDAYIQDAACKADVLVAAWGNPNGFDRARYNRRIATVLQLIDVSRLQLVGRLTCQGYPRHALLWNNDPPIADWPGGR